MPDADFIDGIVCDTDVYQGGGVAWAPQFGGIHIENWQDATHAPPTNAAPSALSGMGPIWGTTNRGFAFGVGPWGWTPVDASGAGLTLTPYGNTWQKTPHGCDVHIDFSYPTTADNRVAVVGGLPNICIPYTNNTAGAIGYATGTSTAIGWFMNNAAQIAFYRADGSGYTNAGMSGVTIDSEHIYTTQK